MYSYNIDLSEESFSPYIVALAQDSTFCRAPAPTCSAKTFSFASPWDCVSCEEMGLKLSARSRFRNSNYMYPGCKDEETSCIPAPANDETATAPMATSTAISPTIVGIARTAVTIATIQKATSPKMNLGSFQGKKTFAKSFVKAE